MMIRASANKRPAPYVCLACRQKLSSSRVSLSLRRPWTARQLSTTAAVLDAKGGAKPSAPLGLFGAGVTTKFGAFARKNAPATSTSSDGLLPHERAAREKTAPAPEPAPEPAPKPSAPAPSAPKPASTPPSNGTNRFSASAPQATPASRSGPNSGSRQRSAPTKPTPASSAGSASSQPIKFGAFARRASPASSSTPSDGLLPHERAARDKASAAQQPSPPPPPPQPPKPQQDQDRALDVSGSNDGSKLSQKGSNRPQRSAPVDRAKSLADLFQSERKPMPPLTPSSWSTGEAPERRADPKAAWQTSKRGMIDRSKPHWGSFRDRRAETNDSTPRAATGKPAGQQTKPPAAPYEAPSKETTNDFWNAFEQRVKDSEQQVKKAPKKEVELDRFGGMGSGWSGEKKTTPDYKPWKPEAEPVVADQSKGWSRGSGRKKGRFEDDGEEAVDSRDRRGGKRVRDETRGWVRQLDEAEDDADLWERRERRKAEKAARKAAQAAEPVEEAAKPIFLPEFVNVATLSRAVQQRTESFLSDLEEMGFENMTEDTIMTGDTAALIAMEYGFEPTVDDGANRDLRPRPQPEDLTALESRPPVVTIMGHVDHGKTTLLDYLRKSSVAAQEHGGITQHIGAFIVEMSSGKPITFLDTPGHAAFLSMRQRGANVTDIVVLVVAADDSVMPQTLEALKHATAAKVPIIVAINKCDKEDARIDQVKADLSRHGVEIEDYGGDVQVVCVSGKTGMGMNDLEENIVTLSEVLDVRAERDGMAEGWILESSVKQDGKAATILVKRGTLRPGDLIVAGTTFSRIRVLRNEAGIELDEAPPGTPVEILGWRDLPEAGQQILQAPDESKARMAVEYRQEMLDREESSKQLAELEQRQREEAAAREAEAEAELNPGWKPEAEVKEKEAGILMQNFVIRADVAGSVEAVVTSVMEQGNNEVRGRVLRSSAGQVTESDVDHAAASGSIIINFSSTILPHVKELANRAGVRIIDQSVIYHLLDDVRSVLADLLPPSVTHRVVGEADVAATFDINIQKRVLRTIAGCKIRNGTIKKNSLVKILRRGKVIFDGKVDTLKHVKKDVQEMGKGSECGIGFEGFQDLMVDDQIQTYEVIKEKRTL